MKMYEELEVWLRAFLMLATVCPHCFAPREGVPGTHLIGDWVPQNWSGCCEEKKNLCCHQELSPSSPVQPKAWYLYWVWFQKIIKMYGLHNGTVRHRIWKNLQEYSVNGIRYQEWEDTQNRVNLHKGSHICRTLCTLLLLLAVILSCWNIILQ
jgi:hypothetical protein